MHDAEHAYTDCNELYILPSIPLIISLYNNRSLSTKSKALFKSMNAVYTFTLFCIKLFNVNI